MNVTVERVTSVEEFLDRTGSFRNEYPVETNLIGAIATGVSNGMKVYQDCFWWILSKGNEVEGIAIRTPPYRLVVSPASQEAIQLLARSVSDNDREFWGVLGPEDTATEFVAKWCELNGRQRSEFPITMRETIYVLGEHTPLLEVKGSAYKATEKDIPLLIDWVLAFAKEAGVFQPNPPTEAEMLSRLESTAMMLWQVDGYPVAMAGHAAIVDGENIRTGRIGPVYTMPTERGHGYGAAVTSAIIEHLESLKCTSIMLYADNDYGKSNRVYQGLGFRPVGAIVERGAHPDLTESS